MRENSSKPDVEEIINSLREGMENITPLQDSHPEMGSQQKLNSSLRKASETSDILGRCGGSLRGKFCKAIARLALPVVEQINLHHSAVLDALTSSNEVQKENLKAHIQKLEQEVEALKKGSNS